MFRAMRISPSEGCSSPAMIFKSVDLPHPFRPTSATRSRSRMDISA